MGVVLWVGASACQLEGPLVSSAFAPSNGPLSVAADFPDGYVGQAYSAAVGPRGGARPYKLSVEGLPDWATFDGARVIGTPPQEGQWDLTFELKDAREISIKQVARLEVCAMPDVVNRRLEDGVVGAVYQTQLQGSGGQPPYRWSIHGVLPDGLSLDAATGEIYGAPLRAQSSFVTVSLEDDNGQRVRRSFEIFIRRPAEALTAEVKLVGEATMDLAGFDVAGVGDVNGDGHDDLIIGAPGRARVDGNPLSLETARGAAYLTYGPVRTNLKLKLLTSANHIKSDQVGAMAGYSVSGGGDINGDGFGDLIVGAPNEGEEDQRRGAVYVVYGPAPDTLNLQAADARLSGDSPGDQLGLSVAMAGDVNNDGFDDLIVGAPGADLTENEAGAAYLFYGPVEGSLSASSADAVMVGQLAQDGVGFSVAAAGDLNGDGFDDLIVGARQRADDSTDADINITAAAVFYGPLSGRYDLQGAADATFIREADRDGQGYHVAAAGDLNDDGFDDIVVSGLLETTGRTVRASCVFYGPVEGTAKLGDADAKLIEAAPTERLIADAAGDVNGDGFDDLIVGNPFIDVAGVEEAGAAYIIHGPLNGTQLLRNAADAVFAGKDPRGHVGFAVAPAGDLNDDGLGDVLIGAPSNNGTGAAYVVYGQR